MTTFLIFLALMLLIFIIRNRVSANSHQNMRDEVLSEIRAENPNYDKELQEAINELSTFEKRKQLYLEGMKRKDYEIGFGWKMSLEDKYW